MYTVSMSLPCKFRWIERWIGSNQLILAELYMGRARLARIQVIQFMSHQNSLKHRTSKLKSNQHIQHPSIQHLSITNKRIITVRNFFYGMCLLQIICQTFPSSCSKIFQVWNDDRKKHSMAKSSKKSISLHSVSAVLLKFVHSNSFTYPNKIFNKFTSNQRNLGCSKINGVCLKMPMNKPLPQET